MLVDGIGKKIVVVWKYIRNKVVKKLIKFIVGVKYKEEK